MEKFICALKDKTEIAKSDSDFAYFFNLLVLGEAITKIIALVLASSLENDKDRHQYRILHELVRADGLGDWSKGIEDMLMGTASQHLAIEAREFHKELTKKCEKDEWQHSAVEELFNALQILNIQTEKPTAKVDLRTWIRNFVVLRNKTRGHGATNVSHATNAAEHLEKSIFFIIENSLAFKIPCAYIKKNLSLKYRVTNISQTSDGFNDVKKLQNYNYEDGIYIFLGKMRKLSLIVSDPDLTDFFIANGSFNGRKYELISYVTDNKQSGSADEYLLPTGQLPPSESEGLGELMPRGNCFSNVPILSYEYISRPELEDQLFTLLVDDRRPVVTLLGRGGIGKTSLALRVIPRLYDSSKYDAIIWFSSRDIDLQASGVKLVNASVVTKKDIAKYFSKLVMDTRDLDKNFDAVKYFQEQLTKSDIGSCLFVFDNFETTENPAEIYNWVDTFVRLPNKVLITTRLREFKGDYPLDVHGMTYDESKELIELTARKLGATQHLGRDLIDEVYRVSAGHPYIIKILIGELSKQNWKGALPKIIAGSEEVLTALFERTYSALTPCAQRIFLTLASWNSAVSRIALEAILMVSIDDPLEVENAIQTLIQFSMIEEVKAKKDGQYFVGLPYVATAFGKKKLNVNPIKNLIADDVKILQKFGPSKLEDDGLDLRSRFERFLSSFNNQDVAYEKYKEIIERICWSYNEGWLILARWMSESQSDNNLISASECLRIFLENERSPKNLIKAWLMLAENARKLNKPLDEIHALIELSQISEVSFDDLSNSANRLNQMLHKEELVVDSSVKRDLASKLLTAMDKRQKSADSNDYSRMAWLSLHMNRQDKAEEYIRKGLEKDNYDAHCLRLAKRLDMQSA